mmetsp:Transcript_97687/g.309789  ORF Transcript_97687/g.309789 Transcript_97687/m.309789 type:complete len:228 (+) Transcript_97687:868-1551(+)
MQPSGRRRRSELPGEARGPRGGRAADAPRRCRPGCFHGGARLPRHWPAAGKAQRTLRQRLALGLEAHRHRHGRRDAVGGLREGEPHVAGRAEAAREPAGPRRRGSLLEQVRPARLGGHGALLRERRGQGRHGQALPPDLRQALGGGGPLRARRGERARRAETRPARPPLRGPGIEEARPLRDHLGAGEPVRGRVGVHGDGSVGRPGPEVAQPAARQPADAGQLRFHL